MSVERSDIYARGTRVTSRGPAILGLEAAGGLTPVRVTVPGLGPSATPVEFHAGLTPAIIYREKDSFPRARRNSRFDLVAITGVRLPISSRLDLRVNAENYIDGEKLAQDGDRWSEVVVSTRVGIQTGGSR